MKRHFEKLTDRAGRAIAHWWLMLVAGIFGIVAGICVFAFPLESYVVISVLFGVLMLVTGGAQLIIASTSGNYLMMKGYIIVGGVIDLLLGLFLCFYPGVTLVLLPIMMGLWLMYHSFMLIAFGGDLDTFRIPGSTWTILGGILLLLLSIFVLVNPFSAGIATVVVVAGVGLVLIGVLFCAIAIKLRDLHKYLATER